MQEAAGRARKCAVSGVVLPEAALIRFAQGPDGVIAPDVAARLPGRGVWVRADRESVSLAVKRNAFARSLKRPAQADPGLADFCESLLARRCLDLLGLGKRAGALALGFQKVEDAIRAAPPLMLVEAADGAADGRAKLVRLTFGLWGVEPRVVGCFSGDELGVALGRDHVVHGCWLQERMVGLWAAEIRRLSGFRAIVPASWRIETKWIGLVAEGAGLSSLSGGDAAGEPAPTAPADQDGDNGNA